jgi:hypothetical protein
MNELYSLQPYGGLKLLYITVSNRRPLVIERPTYRLLVTYSYSSSSIDRYSYAFIRYGSELAVVCSRMLTFNCNVYA